MIEAHVSSVPKSVEKIAIVGTCTKTEVMLLIARLNAVLKTAEAIRDGMKEEKE